MIVRRGEDWGEPAPIPADAVEVESDRDAASVVATARRHGSPLPPIVLRGGDLARTLGVADSLGSDRMRIRVSIDLGAALVDGRLHWFVAHLIARRSWWHGRVLVVANAAFCGRWNVAPRAHPGDGRLDIADSHLSLPDRVRAHRRLASGTHVPHPRIEERRVTSAQFELDPGLDVYVDGTAVGRASTLSVRIDDDPVDIWI